MNEGSQSTGQKERKTSTVTTITKIPKPKIKTVGHGKQRNEPGLLPVQQEQNNSSETSETEILDLENERT